MSESDIRRERVIHAIITTPRNVQDGQWVQDMADAAIKAYEEPEPTIADLIQKSIQNEFALHFPDGPPIPVSTMGRRVLRDLREGSVERLQRANTGILPGTNLNPIIDAIFGEES